MIGKQNQWRIDFNLNAQKTQQNKKKHLPIEIVTKRKEEVEREK